MTRANVCPVKLNVCKVSSASMKIGTSVEGAGGWKRIGGLSEEKNRESLTGSAVGGAGITGASTTV